MSSSPHALATDIHGFLAELDPTRWREDNLPTHALRLNHLAALADRVVSGASQWPERQAADASVHQAVQAVRQALQGVTPQARAGWLDLRDRLSPRYEALAAALRRHGERTLAFNPQNLKRTAFHVSSGLAVVLAYHHVLTPLTAVLAAGGFAGFCWTLEALRRLSTRSNDLMMWFFSPIARDHERYRVNSSTWYGSALLSISVAFPNHLGMLGVLALAVGDPAAAMVGRRFGRIRLPHGKSLEGALAFTLVAGVAGAGYLMMLAHPPLTGVTLWAVAVCAAAGGALAEILTSHLDDNFTVPMSAAAAGALTAWCLGVG